MDLDVRDYPPWREAMRRFAEASFPPGTTIEHGWFYRAFGMMQPERNTPLCQAEVMKLQYLEQFTRFRRAVLVDQKVDLLAVPGVGYRIALPSEQAELAVEDLEAELGKAITRARLRVRHTDTAALTHNERRKHANAAAKAGWYASAFRGQRELPSE